MPGAVTDPRAHALRSRYHRLFGGDELPVPVESIAEDLLGLAIHREDLDGISGVLYPEERQVYVNSSDVPARQRFTIAHELCRAEDVSPAADRAIEREANVFGAELLMPEHAVRRHAGDSDAADVFGVSQLAFSWRLYSFDLAERPA
jgi:Zn-dependent peptidase ImmA (M78 family)